MMRKRDWREVRWHGRGGQGTVTAARVFGAAALREGKYFQAFPEFGPERTGAPVVAFNRIGPTPIWDCSQVYHPDLVVLLDPTLIGAVDLFSGLEGEGKVIINCRDPIPFSLDALGIEGEKEVYIVDASGIARELLGFTARAGGFRGDELALLGRGRGSRRRRRPGPRLSEPRGR
jgi:pyruvate ferredoxin oxidoreductase gamma subunit